MPRSFFPGLRYRPTVLFLAMAIAAGGLVPPAAFSEPPGKSLIPLPTAPAPLPIAVDKSVRKSKFRIIAPAEGSVVAKGKLLVIGRMPEGGGRVDLSVNGSSAGQASVDRNGFFATVALSPGKNAITARSGQQETTLNVTAGPKGEYVWHHSTPEKCSLCHPASDQSMEAAPPKDRVCHKCHARKDKGKYVHGPMGTGDCSVCHDGHGSSHKAFTNAEPLTLCVMCHDQKSSEQHMAKSKGKACTQCHDPHASNKPYHVK
jgi:predicted CXXCH cytochrome family protein